MTAYYNEFDKNAAQWLRNLGAKNLGIVSMKKPTYNAPFWEGFGRLSKWNLKVQLKDLHFLQWIQQLVGPEQLRRRS